jgi:chorismate mutase
MNTLIHNIEEKILKQLNDRLSYHSGNIGNIKFENLHFLKRVKMLDTLYEEVIIQKIWDVVNNITEYDNIIVLNNSVFEETLQIIFDIMDRIGNMNKPCLEHNINNNLRNKLI